MNLLRNRVSDSSVYEEIKPKKNVNMTPLLILPLIETIGMSYLQAIYLASIEIPGTIPLI